MFLMYLGGSICRHGVLTMLMACIHLNHEQLDRFGFFLGALTHNHKEAAEEGGGGGSKAVTFSADGTPSLNLEPIYRDSGSPYVNVALRLSDILDEEWASRVVEKSPLAKSLFDALTIAELARVAEEIYTYAELDKDLYAAGEAIIEARRKDDDEIEQEAQNAKNALDLTKKRYEALLGYAKRAKAFVEQFRSGPKKGEVPYEWLKSVNVSEHDILNDDTAPMEEEQEEEDDDEDYDYGYSYAHDDHGFHHDHNHYDHGHHGHNHPRIGHP